MRIVTEYPFWFIIFCLALGLIYTILLYYRDRKNEFTDRLLRFLAFFRFLVISLIAFLLLSPLLKSVFKFVEKPVILIVEDNTQSILINKDSSFYKKEYPDKLRELKEKLSKSFEVRAYSFGEKTTEDLSFTYSGKQTDVSGLMEEIQTRYSHRNVGAMIIASDGIYNKGASPLYSSEKIKFPLYTIALGDTNPQKDLLVARVNFNRIAYLGNNFPLEIIVNANKLSGASSTLEVTKVNKVVFTRKIQVTGERFSETVNIQLEAKERGLQRYHVTLSPVAGEISQNNNSRDVFIEVLEGKEKILLLSFAAHPDVAALKQSIESNLNYEVDTRIIDEFNDPVTKYNLIILNQLPSIKYPAPAVINKANEAGIPLLFIVGSSTNLSMFNALRTGVFIQNDKNSLNECQPLQNNEFSLFTVSPETRRMIPDFPPLNCPFGPYKMQSSTSILLYQKIGNVNSDRPMIVFNQEPERKYGIILGEGLWKWRIMEFAKTNNHDAFNEIITKSIQYLSVKVNKSFFRVKGNNNYFDNEPIIFSAEVYNQSYELITTPEVEMIITNEDKKTFPFAFTKSNNSYQLNAGALPVGTYSYHAKVKVGDKIYQQQGEFTVSPLNLETFNTTADHNLMFNLAAKHGGKMVYPNELDKLYDMIKSREDIKPISYAQKRFTDLVNLPLVFLIIIFLLGLEWLLRKRAGSY